MRNALLLLALLFAVAGCKVTEGDSSARRRQDAALADPMNYGSRPEDLQRTGGEPPSSVTGGGTFELNKQDLKRDWDSVMGND